MKQWENIGVRTTRNGGGRVLLSILFIILQIMVITIPISNAQTQAAAANLRGKITDEQGAVIEGATVTVRNDARNVERSAQTLGDGSYRLLAIPPGNYQVTVEAQGFGRALYQDIVLVLGQDAVLNAAMRV